jgi:hypothetical protein
MLIRHGGERWHAPASESFNDEATLELLLKESPDLLPGTQGAPLAVVSQLYIPETLSYRHAFHPHPLSEGGGWGQSRACPRL